jgi:hypothetical protein
VRSVLELDTWTCFLCGRHGGYDDPAAQFTLTRVDEGTGKERVLFPRELEEVRAQQRAGRTVRQLGTLGYGIGVVCGDCRSDVAPRGGRD